jgi:hypothetical protein
VKLGQTKLVGTGHDGLRVGTSMPVSMSFGRAQQNVEALGDKVFHDLSLACSGIWPWATAMREAGFRALQAVESCPLVVRETPAARRA